MCKKVFIVSNPSEGVQVVKALKIGGANSLLPLLCCKPVWAYEGSNSESYSSSSAMSPPTFHLLEIEAWAELKVPEGQCCKSALFAASLSQLLGTISNPCVSPSILLLQSAFVRSFQPVKGLYSHGNSCCSQALLWPCWCPALLCC